MRWFKKTKKAEEPATQTTIKCVGRDKEIETIRNRFKEKSSATIIYGDPSIGKSTLLKKINEILKNQASFFTGFHEAEGTEDTLLYALAKLMDDIQKKSTEDYINTLWEKLKGGLTLENFNRFASDLMKALEIPGAKLPDFLRKKFSITIDEKRVPTLNRDIFLHTINILLSQNIKVILIIDNLSVAFEKPVPEHVWERYKTLRNILERTRDLPNLHLLISWKLDSKTEEAFDSISHDFTQYLGSSIRLGIIEDKEIFRNWLKEDCRSYRSLPEDKREKLLDSIDGLPAVPSEWIKEEKDGGTLDFTKLLNITKEVKEKKYGYLLDYIKSEEDKLILLQFSCTPFNTGMTSFQVAELLGVPGDTNPCYCCPPKGIQELTFINWQERCQDVLEKAVRRHILKKDDHEYLFEHETKKEYIKKIALERPTPYLRNALDFYLSHTGFDSNEHPDAHFYVFLACKLLEEVQEKRYLLEPLIPFATAGLTNFNDPKIVSDILTSPNFEDLPIHIKAVVLSEAIKFDELLKEKDINKRLRRLIDTIKENKVTLFQVRTIAMTLTNATEYFGEHGRLGEMKECLDVSKELYQKYPSPELAQRYAGALNNATKHYGKHDRPEEMKECLDVSKELYQKYPSSELAQEYGNALVNATKHYGNHDRLGEMKECLDVSKELYQKYPSPELAQLYARSLFLAFLGRYNYKKEAKRYLKKRDDFLKDKPQVAEAFYKELRELFENSSKRKISDTHN